MAGNVAEERIERKRDWEFFFVDALVAPHWGPVRGQRHRQTGRTGIAQKESEDLGDLRFIPRRRNETSWDTFNRQSRTACDA
jgi:hypothetical protein